MDRIGILDHFQMLALPPGKGQFGHRRGSVCQQALFVSGIDPGLGHHLRPATRADFGLVGLDNQIQRVRIDIALGQQNSLERTHPDGGFRQFRTMIVIVIMVMMVMPVAMRMAVAMLVIVVMMMVMAVIVVVRMFVVVVMCAHDLIMAKTIRACKQSRYDEIH